MFDKFVVDKNLFTTDKNINLIAKVFKEVIKEVDKKTLAFAIANAINKYKLN